MIKKHIETFIKKYNLGGLIEAVKWQINDVEKKLFVSAIGADKDLFAYVELINFDGLPKSEIGIHDTGKLLKMLGILNNDINASYTESGTKLVNLKLDDNSTTVVYCLADLVVIPKSLLIKKLPIFNVEIIINNDFISKYIHAKQALPDTDTFTLRMNKAGLLEFVIGHSNTNSNRIKLSVETIKDLDKVDREISFNATHFKELLVANKDSVASTLKISNAGLMYIEFKIENFKSNYYLIEKKIS